MRSDKKEAGPKTRFWAGLAMRLVFAYFPLPGAGAPSGVLGKATPSCVSRLAIRARWAGVIGEIAQGVVNVLGSGPRGAGWRTLTGTLSAGSVPGQGAEEVCEVEHPDEPGATNAAGTLPALTAIVANAAPAATPKTGITIQRDAVLVSRL